MLLVEEEALVEILVAISSPLSSGVLPEHHPESILAVKNR